MGESVILSQRVLWPSVDLIRVEGVTILLLSRSFFLIKDERIFLQLNPIKECERFFQSLDEWLNPDCILIVFRVLIHLSGRNYYIILLSSHCIVVWCTGDHTAIRKAVSHNSVCGWCYYCVVLVIMTTTTTSLGNNEQHHLATTIIPHHFLPPPPATNGCVAYCVLISGEWFYLHKFVSRHQLLRWIYCGNGIRKCINAIPRALCTACRGRPMGN